LAVGLAAFGAPGAAVSGAPVGADMSGICRPPPEFAGQFGGFASPLNFYDGRAVRDPAEWPERRREILARWHDLMGPWPPLLERPEFTILDVEQRENFQQSRVRIEVAPGQAQIGFLLVPDGAGPFPAVVVPYYDPETSLGMSKTPLRDFALQLARRGFVALAIGAPGGVARQPALGGAGCQPLSYLAYLAANCHRALAARPDVDARRIGIVGHSYGGKWAMFASCLYEEFACAVWSDPGIVFNEAHVSVNYWEPWYLGRDPDRARAAGLITPDNPRTGAYRALVAQGRDVHELHALMAPRPFLVSGGAVDPPAQWRALNHAVAVNRLLGYTDRVAMTNRATHAPTPESNEQIYRFLEQHLKDAKP
jgi:hypothetical protein